MMKMFGPAIRAVFLGAALAAAATLPSFASPEMDTLSKYIGSWKGVGSISGSQSEPVTCRMALTKGNGEKVNYNGRCSIAGTQLAVYGTIAWIADKHRYEAAMTSGIGGFQGVAVGQRSGDNIVFDLQQRANDNEGNDITISARVTLSGDKMGVDFHAKFNKTGEKVDAAIPFTKA